MTGSDVSTTNGEDREVPADPGLTAAEQERLLEAIEAALDGDFSARMRLRRQGLAGDLAKAFNELMRRQAAVTQEVDRVSRRVGRDGRMQERASLAGAQGGWAEQIDAVNQLIDHLVEPIREVARVLAAVADGDLSQRLSLEVGDHRLKGEFLRLGRNVNAMVDQLSVFADEVTRVAREVGTEGELGGQARVKGASGTWKDLTDHVNSMARNLTDQVRNIAEVTTAVAQGDLSRKITVDAQGEILGLKTTINTMVDQLSAFADEVTRVAGEVGTEGQLGGQAKVSGVSGTWKDLTDNVNSMARNLTDQVRNIAAVATAVAHGDLSQRITVDAQGEILELKTTLNRMVDQLSSFADEVTRVAREVGTEGQLGGQARVPGVSGTWEDLTDNVNQLAENLTTQVRAIAEVSTAVTRGDLSQRIDVAASGEVAELKDTINQMIANLSETTEQNTAQDWLKTNIARISTMLQGQRDATAVATQIMTHVTPLVEAHSGAFFCRHREEGAPDSEDELRLIASYAYSQRHSVSNRFRIGEGLVGQAALERIPILVNEAPADYIVQSGLGEAKPVNVLVLPVLFEDELMGVIEFASLSPLTVTSRQLLDELVDTLGVVLHTIEATTRTEELLEQSQGLTHELQAQSEELQTQQEELQQTNEELEEKAELLETQKRAIELTNAEIERARAEVEERAEQLALSSRYKSEFLANMSHELRTPLNSMLILSQLLTEEGDTLTEEQQEFARTIHQSGNELLDLINDILDLSKIEAGRMDVVPATVTVGEVVEPIEQALAQVAADQGLSLHVDIDHAPEQLYTDVRRLQQILKNLVANAIKFTEEGEVRVEVTGRIDPEERPERLGDGDAVAFRVIDTGIGISDELRSVVFEAFQQGDGSHSRRHGGTGLGLSISRELTTLLGGVLTLDSAAGEGSTFTLYLPATYVPSDDLDPEPDVSGPVDRLAPIPETGDLADSAPQELAEATDAASPAGAVSDDREQLRPGEPCLLAMVTTTDEGERVVRLGRAAGHPVIVALDRTAGFALAAGFRPSGILLEGESPTDALATLTYLKRRRETRHMPVCAVVDPELEPDALRAGAAFTIDADPDDEQLDQAIGRVMSLGLDPSRKVLIVEDDEASRRAVSSLLEQAEDIEVVAVESPQEALEALDGGDIDLLVLDLTLPDRDGFDLLEDLRGVAELHALPIVIHTGRDLSRKEETQLRRHVDSIVVKTVGSPARLLDETLLHLHRAPSTLPDEGQRLLEELYAADEALHGKRVLVVDDDDRNAYSLMRVLAVQGLEVETAENGREAFERVRDAEPPYDLVLMDIMMPEMDGHEATRRIRELPDRQDLPIITLTAKAMREDRTESLAAGASDFITKPVDIDQLLSLLRVWLYR